jgi:polyisoprenoid-binding protein YceI
MRAVMALTAILICLGGQAAAMPRTYQLDPAHTIVAFMVDHLVFSRMLGRFKTVEGSFTYDEATHTLSELRVVVKTASIDTDHADRDAHLRSDDFLNVADYPEMVFTAERGELTGPNRGKVFGELTLLGKTRPLTLEAKLNEAAKYPFGHQKYTLGISARGSFQRSEYGMTYGVESGMVGDQIDLIIEIEAIQQD